MFYSVQSVLRQLNQSFRSFLMMTFCIILHWLSSCFTCKQFNFTERWAQPANSSEMENCNNCIFRHNSQAKPGGNCFPLCGLLRMMHYTKCVLLSFFFSEDRWMFWDADNDTVDAIDLYWINNSGFHQQSVDIDQLPCHFFSLLVGKYNL